MCSNAGQPGPPAADLATQLARAIDELAAAARASEHALADGAAHDDTAHDEADQDLAERLARAWAMIAAADPELAARTARYSR